MAVASMPVIWLLMSVLGSRSLASTGADSSAAAAAAPGAAAEVPAGAALRTFLVGTTCRQSHHRHKASVIMADRAWT